MTRAGRAWGPSGWGTDAILRAPLREVRVLWGGSMEESRREKVRTVECGRAGRARPMLQDWEPW